MAKPSSLEKLLIASITPYFLEKGNVWFKEHFDEIADARETQPFFQINTIFLEKGSSYSLSQILRSLDELGYEKVFEITDPGEFTYRGGILEVFPINTNTALQIEFFGNTIETIIPLPIAIADEKKSKELLKKRLKSQELFSDLKGIKEGDYLVHLDHGVARFKGIEKIQAPATTDQTHYKSQEQSAINNQQFYVLEYAAKDTLFVPMGLERKLSRYVGFSDPHVSRLGSIAWQKAKKKIKEEVEKLAGELLELYAKREVTTRPAYVAAAEIEERIDASFPYQETPDQLRAMEDIKQSLADTHPMDRIVCGDVGFGKTEIALRTMAISVENGYQAALLAPTTILAYQHFQNFKQRLKDLPVNIALLSRLQTKKEQTDITKKMKEGQIDMVVGTHRLLSSDVTFRNLGLLVIDDEQRFGVKQKEKLREMRTSLDVLSLSATPIPRTLYMALASLKSVSLIHTPPPGRMPIKIFIMQKKEKIIKDAIEKELGRQGQVYFLHNRIGTIEAVKKWLETLVPNIRIAIVHAKMRENALIEIMDEFRDKKYDLLVATTIIENGIDLPNVNTLIVDDSTHLGLAQSYQIRGRIGRSYKEAFAYFLYSQKQLTEKARLRLEALKEAEDPGSGYKIALRDLEIRGAGNILGKEQAGNVNTVGLNLYCQMLSEAVEKMRGTQA